MTRQESEIIEDWPEESREAARLVIEKYGEPDEATASQMVWRRRGVWKRIIATKAFHQHDFPAPHQDMIETVIDYRAPPEKMSEIAAFDGSVMVDRTAGEVSARCHDEEANTLALNLMHDIVMGAKSSEEARAYYAKEFTDYRRNKPTPYMDRLNFTPVDRDAADPDVRLISDEELEQAKKEGRKTP